MDYNIDEIIAELKQSVRECERIAIEFMEWVDMNIKAPQEDD